MKFQHKLKYSLGDLELWAPHCAHQRKKDRHWQVRFHSAAWQHLACPYKRR